MVAEAEDGMQEGRSSPGGHMHPAQLSWNQAARPAATGTKSSVSSRRREMDYRFDRAWFELRRTRSSHRLAFAASRVRQAGNHLYGEGLTARRAGFRPITTAFWALLHNELRSVECTAVDAQIHQIATLRIITGQEAGHGEDLLEGGTRNTPYGENRQYRSYTDKVRLAG